MFFDFMTGGMNEIRSVFSTWPAIGGLYMLKLKFLYLCMPLHREVSEPKKNLRAKEKILGIRLLAWILT